METWVSTKARMESSQDLEYPPHTPPKVDKHSTAAIGGRLHCSGPAAGVMTLGPNDFGDAVWLDINWRPPVIKSKASCSM